MRKLFGIFALALTFLGQLAVAKTAAQSDLDSQKIAQFLKSNSIPSTDMAAKPWTEETEK